MRERRPIAQEIRAAIQNHNLQEALGLFTEGMGLLRASAFQDLPEYEELRAQARRIKEETIKNLGAYLQKLKANVEANGGTVFFAKDGTEACRYIVELARQHKAQTIVKSKSMTAEEIALNRALEEAGVEVIETDLGERIVQLAREKPSHLVGPALHKTQEEVAKLFARWLNLKEPPKEAQALTELARSALRKSFLSADMGITGVNFAIAETGTLVLIENEGNIRLTALLPPIHIALMGTEKVIPSLDDLPVFLKLLPRSTTGQKLTSYISLISGPTDSPHLKQKRELHLLVLDNGRSRMRADPDLREALYCIRCGACLNICAPYQGVGGHVYGGRTYMGGIGCAWEAGVYGLTAAARFNELCTTCARCKEVCPVKIDIPWLNTVVKHKVQRLRGKRALSQKFFGHTDLLNAWGSRLAPLSNGLLNQKLVRILLERLFGIDRRQVLPTFQRQTFVRWFKRRRNSEPNACGRRVAFFYDCFTNHFEPDVAIAAVRVLERSGVSVQLASRCCCGRTLMSQGLIEEARKRAEYNVARLSKLINNGYDIVGIEPSCISAIKENYHHLLKGDTVEAVVRNSYEIMEYLALLHREGQLKWDFSHKPKMKLVFHGHCQQKATGGNETVIEFLRSFPNFDVQVVEVSCCGMAGSFGYKKDYTELSRHLGRKLSQKLEALEGQILASGFSCRAQIQEGTEKTAIHPIQIIERLLFDHLRG